MNPSQNLKLAITLCLISCLCIISCKKDSTSIVSSTVVVRYEVSWSAPLYQVIPNFNSIAYTNANGNTESDSNVSGNSWVKNVTISKASFKTLDLAATLFLQQSGTCNVKIYVDDVLKSQNSSTGTNAGSAYSYYVPAQWVKQ